MKKCTSFLLVVVLILSIVPGVSISALESHDDYSYTIIDNQARIDQYIGYYVPNSTVEIPVELGGYPVTTIGPSAFYGRDDIAKIIIPNGLIHIDDCAFKECSNLTDVTIGDSITSIGNYAFYNCSNLTDVTIGDSVTSIGVSAFYNCSNLTGITIGDSVTSIGNDAFYNCSNLTDVTIGDSVTSIGNYVFYNCSNLTDVTIGDSVTSIGNYAFHYCDSLKNVTFGDNVASIGEYAFVGCDGLTELSLPNSLVSIGRYAFSCCDGLVGISLPSGLSHLGEYAFNDCAGLTEITLPGSIVDMGMSTFYNCSSLTYVCVSEGVTKLAKYAFYNCNELKEIGIPSTLSYVENGVFEKCTNLEVVYCYGSKSPSTIGMYNKYFTNAKWYYNFCGEGNHNYTSSCDDICDTCQVPRINTSPHEYYNDCDATCNFCGFFRTVTHSYDGTDDLTCNVCKESLQPSAPILINYTDNTVTLEATKGFEYSLDGEHWQASNVFTGLSPATKYTFHQRVAESNESFASEMSPALVVTTDKATLEAPAIPVVDSGSETSVILQEVPGCEYSMDGINWQNSTIFSGLSINTEYTFYQRVAATESNYTSASSEPLCVILRPAGQVTYDANGGAYALDTQIKIAGINLMLAELEPSQSNHYFTGWAVSRHGEIAYMPGDYFTEDSNITLYAIWKPKCTLCDGDGTITISCYRCDGSGQVYTKYYVSSCCRKQMYRSLETGGYLCGWCGGIFYTLIDQYGPRSCDSCNGDGIIEPECNTCNGSGWAKYTHEVAPAPTLESKTVSSITLVQAEDMEYSMDGIAWQDSNVFEGLKGGTEYTFYQRYKETSTHLAAEPSEALVVQTDAPPYTAGDVNTDEKINSLDGLLLLRYLNGWDITIPSEDAMDVNADGKVNSLDGLILMRYLNGWDVTLG